MNTFFLSPVYRISPFETSDYAKTIQYISQAHLDKSKCEPIKNDYNEYYTGSGREAIQLYLKNLQLKKEDEVAIITTTSSYYVSACVTSTIEKICKWARKITNKTKCIIIIHEFGKFYPHIKELYKYNIPILEDFAHSFSALYYTDVIQGDAAIFSLSKFLPLNGGGLLLSKEALKVKNNENYHFLYQKYREDIFNFFKKRKVVENHYINELAKLDISPYFNYDKNESPGAFVFRIDKSLDYLQNMKIYLQSNFIECSVFYKNKAFFLPCHHKLEVEDVKYITNLIKEYIEKNDNQ